MLCILEPEGWLVGFETSFEPRSEVVSSLGGCKKQVRSKLRGLDLPPGLNVNFPAGWGLDPASKITAEAGCTQAQVGGWAGPLH